MVRWGTSQAARNPVRPAGRVLCAVPDVVAAVPDVLVPLGLGEIAPGDLAGLLYPSARRGPQPSGAIVRSTGQQCPVGAERDRIDGNGVQGQGATELCSGGHIPEPDGVVGVRGREQSPIRAEREPVHRATVVEGPDDFPGGQIHSWTGAPLVADPAVASSLLPGLNATTDMSAISCEGSVSPATRVPVALSQSTTPRPVATASSLPSGLNARPWAVPRRITTACSVQAGQVPHPHAVRVQHVPVIRPGDREQLPVWTDRDRGLHRVAAAQRPSQLSGPGVPQLQGAPGRREQSAAGAERQARDRPGAQRLVRGERGAQRGDGPARGHPP